MVDGDPGSPNLVDGNLEKTNGARVINPIRICDLWVFLRVLDDDT